MRLTCRLPHVGTGRNSAAATSKTHATSAGSSAPGVLTARTVPPTAATATTNQMKILAAIGSGSESPLAFEEAMRQQSLLPLPGSGSTSVGGLANSLLLHVW